MKEREKALLENEQELEVSGEQEVDSSQYSLEKCKALEIDNTERVSELMKLTELCLVGRGFPSEVLLKEDGKLTSFYNGLPNYGVLKAVFNLIEKKILDTSIKLTLS